MVVYLFFHNAVEEVYGQRPQAVGERLPEKLLILGVVIRQRHVDARKDFARFELLVVAQLGVRAGDTFPGPGLVFGGVGLDYTVEVLVRLAVVALFHRRESLPVKLAEVDRFSADELPGQESRAAIFTRILTPLRRAERAAAFGAAGRGQ